MTAPVRLSLLALLVAAPAAADSFTPITERTAESCGTRQVPGEAASTGWALAPGAQRTIYLNRFGGTYQIGGGATNSATNTTSSIVSANGSMKTAVIPPLGADFDWPMISACVRDHFAPYHVRIVETEPTSGVYVEAVVGGTGAPLGFSPGALLGIASADNFCGVTEAGIAFNFSEAHRGFNGKNLELCATIAHEIGHLLALEHKTHAPDLMSYVPVSQSPNKSFVDQFSPCGTTPGQNQQCACTSGMSNSHERLNLAVGLRPVESVKPTIELTSPRQGTVPPTFEVVVTAKDPGGAMSDVIVLIDGLEVGNSNTPTGDTYKVIARNAPLGSHKLTVVARDAAGNEQAVETMIEIAKLALGETCIADDACAGDLCALTTEGGFCTQTCDLAAQDCPAGFECQDAGGRSLCVEVESGCGCSGGPSGATPWLLVGVGLLLWGPRRRRSHRS